MRREAQGDDDEDGETESDLDSDAKRVLSNIRAIARRRRTAPALGEGGSLAVEAQGAGFGMHVGGSRKRFPANANSSVRVDVKRG